MAGYIGKSQGITQVDGYNKAEADSKFVEGDDTLYVDETNSRVGVGTSSPAAPLEVVSAGGLPIIATSTSSKASIAFEASGTTYRPFIGADGDNLHFSTGLAYEERMRIDSAGSVTMPYQPFAVAYFGDSNYLTRGTNWTMGNTKVNTGSYYSTSTGRFTCPVDGVYEVSGFTLTGSDGDAYYLIVRKNGIEASRAYQYTRAGNMHALVKCNANDYLQFGADSDVRAFYGGKNYTNVHFRLVG